MSTVEREAEQRDGVREDLRQRIVEAARDIVSEEGLDGLSMRALAVRIGYSPATIYHHFHDKEELLGSVMEEGFKRLRTVVEKELGRGREGLPPMERFGLMARGYARFALENTGYFRAMFEVPGVAKVAGCPAARPGPLTRDAAVELLREAEAGGEVTLGDVDRAALLAWGIVHGLTSLYLTGHLAEDLAEDLGSHDAFMDLVESGIDALREGWKVGRDGA
jgi:AcrR family transcriptional regulator